MARHFHRSRVSMQTMLFSRAALLLSITFILIIAALSFNSREPFTSSEVKFSDSSMSGLSIMPASCPSDPHWEGECNSPIVASCIGYPSTLPAGGGSVMWGAQAYGGVLPYTFVWGDSEGRSGNTGGVS